MQNCKNNRKDVLAKVQGKAVYANDMQLPGMMHGVVVRSPHSAARILRISTEKALGMPGVLAVLTGADVPGIPAQPKERPALCVQQVRYVGDGVAFMVAETRKQAEAAAKLVEVEYEVMPALLDARLAMDEAAPRVHEGGNLICKFETKRGDAAAALETAPHVLEKDYTTQRVQHACIETEAVVAVHDEMNGETTVHCPVNSPFVVRKIVADTLGVRQNDVRVVLAAIGGSFGGKNHDISMAASRAAMAAKRLGRPCKVVLTREESIMEGTKRHPLLARYKVGFDGEGKLLGAKIDLLLDGGAYTSKTHPVTSRMAIEATGPYYVPNVHTTSKSVYTNNVYSDALRGFGSPQVDFCSESLMDEIAAYLGKDPLEVRKLNMYKEGGPSSFGQTMTDVRLEECIAALDESCGGIEAKKAGAAAFNAKSAEMKKGFGVALLHRGESFGAAGQGVDAAGGMVSIQPDGSVSVSSSIAEVGQGAATMLVNLLHETLGVARENIRVGKVDTAYVTDAGPTVATRGTVFSGGAVWKAAEKLKVKLAKYAEKHLGTADAIFENSQIIDKNNSKNAVAFADVVKDVFAVGDHLNALGHFEAPPLAYDKSCGVGEAYMSYVYGAAAAAVTVDTKTGFVSVDEYWAVHDVGHAFDMEEVKGQIAGGVSMGVGYAVMEEVEMADGRVKSLNLDSYLLPTVLDMPKITPVVLEFPGEHGPLGAKGLGEPATCAVAPAITSAIENACGRRVRNLPANLEEVALGKKLAK